MFGILQFKTPTNLAASTCRVLKHSFKMMTCTAAMALVSLSFTPAGKAEPPGGTAGWTKAFDATFTSGFDTNKWNKTFWWGDGNINDGAVSYYSPNNVYVSSNGNLRLVANNNSENGKPYTGGVITTYGKFYQTYGYFESRIQVPKGGGLGPDFSLLAEDTSWPPELNIFEIPGGSASANATTLWMTNHYIDANGNPTYVQGHWTAGSGLDGGYHTYGLLWQPGLLVWYLDGIERYRTTVGVPGKPCYIVLMSGVSDDSKTNYGFWSGSPANTTFPKYMSVQWVRAWRH